MTVTFTSIIISVFAGVVGSIIVNGIQKKIKKNKEKQTSLDNS